MTSLFVSLLRLSVKKLQITKDEQSTGTLLARTARNVV